MVATRPTKEVLALLEINTDLKYENLICSNKLISSRITAVNN